MLYPAELRAPRCRLCSEVAFLQVFRKLSPRRARERPRPFSSLGAPGRTRGRRCAARRAGPCLPSDGCGREPRELIRCGGGHDHDHGRSRRRGCGRGGAPRGAARGRRGDRRRLGPPGGRAHRAPCRHPSAGSRRRGKWRGAVCRAGAGRAERVARRAGGDICLPADAPRDRYGRLVAQVERADGVWLQGALLERGLAQVQTRPGETARADEMLAIERTARAARRGLWAEPAWMAQEAERARDSTGRFRVVCGRWCGSRRPSATCT